MSTKKQKSNTGENPVSRGRHEYQCRICAHIQRADIEEAFVNWVSSARIAKQYDVSRDAIYRHAHALGLMGQRRRNIRAALERIIEKAGEVQVNATAVVSAASAYARINSRGEWVERTEDRKPQCALREDEPSGDGSLCQRRSSPRVVHGDSGCDSLLQSGNRK